MQKKNYHSTKSTDAHKILNNHFDLQKQMYWYLCRFAATYVTFTEMFLFMYWIAANNEYYMYSSHFFSVCDAK